MIFEYLLTFAPPLLILIYIISHDRYPEPPKVIISSFLLGYLICLPAGELNYLLIDTKDNPENFAFLAGFTEEFLKFLAFYLFIADRIEFDEPMDAIVYGTLISLGFATYENYEYVFLYNDEFSSLYVAAIRAFTAIPLHACCGIIMGFYLGKYLRCGKLHLLLFGLVFPIMVHAFYNYIDNLAQTLIYLTLIILVTFKMHLSAKKEQEELSSN